MTGDIKNFCLNISLLRYEYVWLKLAYILEEMIVEYSLREKVSPDGTIYIKIYKGMYDLPQLGLIAQQLLEMRLENYGFDQAN